ncbi:MAG: twin-arginine translocation pathway signal protein [Limnobacter sp.]|nr:twin-arginine translocation pathway signal protein [Limnobacter sp.]
MTSRRHFLAASAAATLLPAAALPSRAFATAADTAPTRPVRWVVGFAPGGGTDTIARMTADTIRDAYPAGLLIENKPGASSRLAVRTVKDAEPDGQTMLVTPDFALTVYPHSFREPGYEPLKDLAPVAPICIGGLALCVGPMVPETVKNPADFLDWCQQNPKLAFFGSPASGSSFHFAGIMLGRAKNVELTHIGYKGGAPALQDVMGGQIASNICAVGEAFPYLQSGKLRAIGTFGTERDEFAPEAPTMVESGFDDVIAYAWVGALAPAATSPQAIARMESALNRATSGDVLTERLAKFCFKPLTMSSDEFRQMIAADIERWGPVVKATGFTADE